MILEALLLAQLVQTKTVNLSWQESDLTAVSYKMYRAPESCSQNPQFVEIGVSQTKSFVDHVSQGHYCYQVTALNSSGNESKPSNQFDVFIPAPATGLKGNVE